MTFTRISPKKAVAAEHKSKEKNYWLEKLTGFDEPVGFPYDFHQPPAALQPTAAYTHPLAPDLFALLVKVSNGSEARLHMVLLTGLGMLLHKMTGKPAFIISTPVYKQNHQTERINTVLPIAVRVDPAASYKELLLQVRQTLVEATEHQGYPVQLLPDLLQILPNGAGFPLFEVGLLLENIQDYPDLAAVPHTAIFSFAKTDTDVSLTVHYAPERYEAATIRRTVDLLESALRTALTHVDLPLADITLLTEPEKHQVLHQFNQTRTEYPKAETLVALFEAQAEQTPEALALVYGELTYTYRQLNTRANQLARYIREKHAPQPGELIGLLVERSDKAIISLLGILKAGGAYLPIDPEWPEARIRLVLEDTGVTCLLQSSAHQTAATPTAARQRVVLEEAWHEMTRQPAQNPHPAGAASDLAYVMYTSGSTGTPKGVMVEHRNIVRLVKNTNYLTITPQDRMLQAAPLSFDAATFEIWGALLNGASLHVAPKETVLDPAQLEIFLQKNPVTVGWLTASLFNNLVNQQPQLFAAMRALLVGGEALSPGHVRKAREHNKGLTLINGYGPTENTTFSACFRIEKDHADAIPIGSPVANSQCYVLSDTLAVQPIGVPGELYVAGDGVARGYWNQDALTREKFRENPFVPGGRMYKTGDLAKWLPDGNLAFLGRKDDQVKIRGYRIEPQEIRQALLGLDGIREAVIVVREDPGAGQPYLCAYLVSDSAPDAGQLGAALGKSLPAYMVPAYFVAVDKIPLTANGKVNQQALPAPQITRGASGLPKNAVEEKLVRIWADVLGLEKEQIGTHASFFALGGHSLKAARMLSQIHRELEVKLSLKDTFALTTIAQLAEAIEARQPEKYQSIPKADEKRFYPLSSTQKRLYVLQQMEVDTVSYNLPSVAILEGNLDQDRLEATFKQLIERHESLRTSFELILGQPLQKIHKAVHFAIERYDAGTAGERPEDIIKDFVRPFLLNKAPLLRVGLKPIAADKHYLMVDMHHIISDGVSEDIFRREFMALYGGETVAPLRLQYKDFSEWKNQSAQKEATRGQEEYWLREFAGEVPVLQLPTDYPRPAVQSFEGEAAHFHLPEAAAQAVRELALREGTTPYNVLLAVFNVLLGKLSGQDDVVVGTPVAGRRHAELDAIIGVFVNTLVLRNYPQGDKTFRAFLAEVNRRTLEAFDHQDYPFEDLVEKVAVSRDTSRNPLFSVMFNYHNIGTVAVAIPGLRLLPFEAEQKVSKFDLSLDVLDLDGALSFAFEYSTRLFKAETIGRIIHYFTSVVSAVLARPEATLGSVEIITEAEKQQVLYGFNRKTIAYPKDQTVQALLEAQVARSPESVAVEFEGEPLTYAALNHKANGLARRLREQGVKPGTVVGVMIDRSLDLPVALAAILKAGGAYLPIDPAYPEARQQYMLADSQVDVLLTQKQFLETHPSLRSANDTRQIICVDEEASCAGEGGNPENPNQPGDLLYVVYTSGTTGDAKGIMVEHRNLLAYLAAFNEIFAQTADDVTLQITSVSFDIFAEQFWGTLLKGGKIIIPKEEAVKDAEKLSRLIRRHKVTLVSCPPLILNELNKLKPLSSVRAFINGGDVLKPAYVSALHTYAKVYNGYGPAETTIGATHYLYEGEAVTTIPIGPPMSNYRIYILDGNEKPLPVGVPGELCISGDAVSRGYIGKPELTAQKFVANPFVPGERMYKTGDLAKWLPDGNLAFVGRVDQQVKIRGYRIEPGEIESHLRKHEAIAEALVVAREDKKEKYLCAYYQAGSALEVAALRAFLLQSLPDYMVPAYFVRITRIPMTPNGKVNVKELPVPTLKAAADFVAPRNEMEARLVAIWAAVLEAEKDNISVETDFFAVGGNSINATQLIAKIQKEFSITMPLVEAFKAPNISLQAVFIGSELAKKQAEKATLAEQLRDNGEFAADILHAGTLADGNQAASSGAPADEIPVEAVPRQPHYPLSSGQRRMYILNQLDKEATNYNMFGAFEINGQLDRDRLEGVIAQLFRRHESLRTHFEMIDGEMVQVVSEKAEVAVEYFDQVEESQVQAIVRDFVRPFDLGRAPLFRVGLITLRAERYVLLLDTHHIVTDGVSMQILIEEFVRLSGGEELPALPYQYKDYTHWQQKRMESAAFGAHERYWLERLGGDLPVLHLPTDYRRPLVQRFAGDLVSFELDAETTTRLRTLGNETGTTVYMILLAAYQVLFHKYTGQSDILIGSPVAVRPVNDFARILGMFANTVVMRGYPEGRKKFSTFLDEVKTATVEAVTHQEYPFEELIELLHIKRDLSRNPVFDVMFASQNTGKNREIQLQKLQVKPYPFPTTTSMFDLLLNAVETETHIDFTVIFNTSLFKRETVSRFCAHYLRILEQVAANKDALIGEIDLLTEPERKRMLETFNQTAAAFPVQQTLVSLLQAQAAQTPERTAVLFEDRSLTYRELDAAAHALARYLREEYAVQPGELVGILMDRSEWMVIGLLGILKAGAAYVPIDPTYPEERVRYLLTDAAVRVMLTDEATRQKGSPIPGTEAVVVAGQWPRILAGANGTLAPDLARPEHTAYLIYTSGSTGAPKGVEITHRNAVAFLSWAQGAFAASDFELVLAGTSYCFDLSVFEIFFTLSVGKTLRVLKSNLEIGQYLDPARKILVNTVPSVVEGLLKEKVDLSPVTVLNMAGEPVPFYFKDLIDHQTREVRNLYGPSEDTTYSTCYRFSAAHDLIPAGKPIANTRVYIVDEALRLLPEGLVGEICLAGEGLAKGYRNKPALTDRAFVANPFEPGQRMYRTGDLGRWLPDGNLEFMGRKDYQVKIRGYRIELGEIENALQAHAHIQQAVVVAQTGADGEKYLAAYYVSTGALSPAQVKRDLQRRLPDYLIPAHLVPLAALPLTPNGKIDRKALPSPESLVTAATIERVEARDELERKLAGLWREVVGGEKIGIRDNFFEMGGHSLKAARLVTLISKELQARISLKDIFTNPTIESLAGIIRGLEPGRYGFIGDAPTAHAAGEPPAIVRHQSPGSPAAADSAATKIPEALTIIAFPYAGGNQYSFAPWKQYLPADVKLVTLEAPGREHPEELLTDLNRIVDALFAQVKSHIRTPYVFFGHSMGSLVSYLVTKRILAENLTPPVHLFVSGRPGPQVPPSGTPVHQLSSEAFMQELKQFRVIPPELYGDQNSLRYIEQLLRADYAAIEQYRYTPSAPFAVPVTVFYGKREGLSERMLRESWQRETTRPVTVQAFAGDHFFLFDHWQKMSEMMVATVQKK